MGMQGSNGFQFGAGPMRWSHKPVKRISKLRGMPVIELASAQRMGNVTNVFINPNDGSVESFAVSRVGESPERNVKAADVRRIGNDALIMLPAARWPIVRHPIDRPGEPPEDPLDVRTITGLEVMAETGDRMGYVSDVFVNSETLEIESYELETPHWERFFRGQRQIRSDSILICSHEVMLIRAGDSDGGIGLAPEFAGRARGDDDGYHRAASRSESAPSEDHDLGKTAVRSA